MGQWLIHHQGSLDPKLSLPPAPIEKAPVALNLQVMRDFFTKECRITLTDKTISRMIEVLRGGKSISLSRRKKKTYFNSPAQFSVDLVPQFANGVFVGCTADQLMPGENLRKKKTAKNLALLNIDLTPNQEDNARDGLKSGFIGKGEQSRIVKALRTWNITTTEYTLRTNPEQQNIVKVIPASKTTSKKIQQELAVTKAAYGAERVTLVEKYDQNGDIKTYHLIMPNLNSEKKSWDLFDFLYKKNLPLTDKHRIRLSILLLDVLEGLKKKGISHRDLKLENLIVDYTVNADREITIKKLIPIDFGLSCMMDQAGTDDDVYNGSFFGSSDYLTPEMAHRGWDETHIYDVSAIQGNYADRVAANRMLEEIWGSKFKNPDTCNEKFKNIYFKQDLFIEDPNESFFKKVFRELAVPLKLMDDKGISVENLKIGYEAVQSYIYGNYYKIKPYMDEIEKYLEKKFFYFEGSDFDEDIHNVINFIGGFLAYEKLNLGKRIELIQQYLPTIINKTKTLCDQPQILSMFIGKIEQLGEELKYREELEEKFGPDFYLLKKDNHDFVPFSNLEAVACKKIEAAYSSLETIALYLDSLEHASKEKSVIQAEIAIIKNNTLELFKTCVVDATGGPSRIMENPGLKIALSIQHFADSIHTPEALPLIPAAKEQYKASVLQGLKQLKPTMEDIREDHSARFYYAKQLSDCIDSILNGIRQFFSFSPPLPPPTTFTTSVLFPEGVQVEAQLLNTMVTKCTSPLPSETTLVYTP